MNIDPVPGKVVRAIAFSMIILLASCSEKYGYVADDKFVGLWELSGRSMFNGIQVRIQKEDNAFVGKIVKLNANKYVQMFADTNDVWVSGIDRSSNFAFRLTERKLARELFSVYGMSGSQEFKVQFIDDNTLGLATEGADPLNSTVVYKRIKE
jgi:hypothetical protein